MSSKQSLARGALVSLAALLSMSSGASGQVEARESGGDSESIEIALLLDTSDSMESLIDAARLGLWEVVNELARLKPAPGLRVALIGYGGRTEGAENGWVRVRSPLTSDLDHVSEQLFELTTKGGTEYVGRALATALRELDWSPPAPDNLRMIFLAGNESADQDAETDLLAVGRAADSGDFRLYAIYFGQPGGADAESWRSLVMAAHGQLATLDVSATKGHLGTPFDSEMVEMGRKLNATYLPWGTAGKAGLKAQAAQDKKVAALSQAAAAARAETKAGALYEPEWDLVDAVTAGRVELSQVDRESLPRALRGLPEAGLAAWVEQTRLEREELRGRILALGEQRRQALDEQARARGAGGAASFEAIVREAIRKELEQRGFRSESD
jgi:hypothetical protein